MECAGIHEDDVADPGFARAVGVSVEDDVFVAGAFGVSAALVVFAAIDDSLELGFVPVEDGDSSAGEFEREGDAFGRIESDRAGVLRQGGCSEVRVSPDEPCSLSGEFVEHAVTADIAAMDDSFGIERFEGLECATEGEVSSVGVG